MSARSTPTAARTSSTSLFSPTGSSMTDSSIPKPKTRGSYGFPSLGQSSRRASGNTVPAVSRKASGTSTVGATAPSMARRVSSHSASGTATPRSRRNNGLGTTSKLLENVAENDWAAMDPDEVFRRLGVADVRRVEATMRADAANKQSELRSMVGTRYRDLLTSATQITSLRESSLHLSSSLKSVAQACLDPTDLENGGRTSDAGDQNETEEIMSLLPIAAHMKLLLDAPEALYAHLARRDYLKAAFLWLVARATKEGLSSINDSHQAYTPLLEKQWDLLLPFRSQISQRAAADLRQTSSLNSQTLSETILAIILLDNLPMPEALSLFLSQRSKHCHDILAKSSNHSKFRHPSKQLSLTAATSASSVPAGQNIDKTLSESVSVMIATERLAQECFGLEGDAMESLLGKMIRLVQHGEPSQPARTPNPAAQSTVSHRRASRLASFSTPIQKVNISADGPPMSSARVLQDLPSHQILLRHLPSSIVSYTPFIAPSSTPDLKTSLSSWIKETTQLLQESLPVWFDGLSSIAEIWKTRCAICALLKESELETQIKNVLELESDKRIQAVWTNNLRELVTLAETQVRLALEQLRSGGPQPDRIPDDFTFVDLPFPAATSMALSSANSLNGFLSAVRKRKLGRTPLLDSVVSSLESAAKTLHDDSQGLPDAIFSSYAEQVQQTQRKLVGTLSAALESSSDSEAIAKVDAELLIGRVALFLAKSSSFLPDLYMNTVDSGPAVDELVKLHITSVQTWRKEAIEEAIRQIKTIFDPQIGPSEIQAMWQGPHPTSPSAGIMSALSALVKATRRLGIPNGVDTRVVVQLMDEFLPTAIGLQQWMGMERESAAQAVFDLGFLILIKGDNVASSETIKRHLARIPSTVPSSFASDLPDLLVDHLRRVQLLLSPLLAHIQPSTIISDAKPLDTRNGLLRFGAPKSASAGAGTEFKGPIALATPGKRFPLLSIAA
ncbi:hypothetical protein BD324DRAFT_82122 [Kockovaella imperatae]|uniref:Conserved oligomeric Golgi complex subunit 1 n=1 Tax=Kockovaella imperatae TaxID=4999 RepID=A0A1Y1UB10_9TREE|nr:hypothetical protein BD324DRAFT_82122 [Kockovaella imperatae]ORX35220.1 hypothetical protein BD324DRAFT_82122 [Kockovaella imperatae]